MFSCSTSARSRDKGSACISRLEKLKVSTTGCHVNLENGQQQFILSRQSATVPEDFRATANLDLCRRFGHHMFLALILVSIDRCARLRVQVFDRYRRPTGQILLRIRSAELPYVYPTRTYAVAFGNLVDLYRHVLARDGLVGDREGSGCSCQQRESFGGQLNRIRSTFADVRPKRYSFPGRSQMRRPGINRVSSCRWLLSAGSSIRTPSAFPSFSSSHIAEVSI